MTEINDLAQGIDRTDTKEPFHPNLLKLPIGLCQLLDLLAVEQEEIDITPG